MAGFGQLCCSKMLLRLERCSKLMGKEVPVVELGSGIVE